MRVIGGEWRSRVLRAPSGVSTRPTSDRLRETLFNVLAGRVAGALFADLFAGSGAVGLEALSRGAGHVSFVESARPALVALRANCDALGVEKGSHRVCADNVAEFLQRKPARKFDAVFLDPPYEDGEAYLSTLSLLTSNLWLAEDAVVIAEHSAPLRRADVVDLPDKFGGLGRYRVLTQGDAALSFYRVV